jgi:hypothetical protein
MSISESDGILLLCHDGKRRDRDFLRKRRYTPLPESDMWIIGWAKDGLRGGEDGKGIKVILRNQFSLPILLIEY